MEAARAQHSAAGEREAAARKEAARRGEEWEQARSGRGQAAEEMRRAEMEAEAAMAKVEGIRILEGAMWDARDGVLAGGKQNATGGRVYVGRNQGGTWGNRVATVRRGATAEELWAATARYAMAILRDTAWVRRVRTSLQGKGQRGEELVCHCRPHWCHGQVMAAVIRSETADLARMMRGAQEMTAQDVEVWVEGRERGLEHLREAMERSGSDARLARDESRRADEHADRQRAASMRASAAVEAAVRERRRTHREYREARRLHKAAEAAEAKEQLAVGKADGSEGRAEGGERGGRGTKRVRRVDGGQDGEAEGGGGGGTSEEGEPEQVGPSDGGATDNGDRGEGGGAGTGEVGSEGAGDGGGDGQGGGGVGRTGGQPAEPGSSAEGHDRRPRRKRTHANTGGQRQSAAKLARLAEAEPDDSWTIGWT